MLDTYCPTRPPQENGGASACQTVFKAVLSCDSTPTAPISRVSSPTAVPSTPAVGASAASPSIVSMAVRPDEPTSAVACSTICARARSSPSTKPAMPMAIKSNGAREKTV
jgi:hypothetical protein